MPVTDWPLFLPRVLEVLVVMSASSSRARAGGTTPEDEPEAGVGNAELPGAGGEGRSSKSAQGSAARSGGGTGAASTGPTAE